MKKQLLLSALIALQLMLIAQLSGAQNLIASYPFNGNANDISGHGLNGTIIGSPGFVTDRFGNANSAIQFYDYTAHRVEVDDNALLHTSSITIAAWVNQTGITNMLKTIVDKPLGTGTSDSWHLGIAPGASFFYSSWLFNDPGTATGSQIISPAYVGDWHYVVATFDNTTKLHKLYIDGILKATNTFNSTIGYDNNKMYIGAALENNGLNFPMDGALDDIKIYDAALTDQQIAADYAAGLIYDNTGSGSSIYLDGSSGQYFVQLPSLLDGTNIFTVDFWVKTTESGSNPTYWLNPALVGNANPVSPDGDFGITLNNGQIGVWSGLCSCGDQALQTDKTINDDKWHHVAAVSDGANMVLYVDGMLLPGSISTAGGTLQTAARPWRIGMLNSCCSNGSPARANIDEFRVWNTALTQTQLRDRMCKKTGSSDGLYGNLVAYYHFNETIGSAMVDSKNNNAGFLNLGTRLTSGAPVGDASAFDYTNAVKTAAISHASGETFTVTSTSGNPDGIQVYRVDQQPNTLDGTVSIGAMNKYFGVFQSGGASPQYSAVYNYTGNPDVNAGNESSLTLYKRTDNSVTNWSNGIAVINMVANTLTITGQSTEYILGRSGVLPLQLLSFTAVKQNDDVLLQWQTTNEINTSHFELERSSDGINFEKIGTVDAINNSGTHIYRFTDNDPLKSINYYRLRQVDNDGQYNTSPIAKVLFSKTASASFIFPNPAKNKIAIRYTGSEKTIGLSIFDQTGRLVLTKKLNSENLSEIDVSALPQGTYIVELNDGVKRSSSKLIKL